MGGDTAVRQRERLGWRRPSQDWYAEGDVPSWLTARQEIMSAALELITMAEFEPEVWVSPAQTAARRGSISLEELTALQVIHRPRREHPGPPRRAECPPARQRPRSRPARGAGRSDRVAEPASEILPCAFATGRCPG